MTKILIIAGPTASGKSGLAVAKALAKQGEIISVDSRQVYRGLDIGTEKITKEEMRGVPHYLIDILDPSEKYSAGRFAEDAARLISEISGRGKLPILAGGTHFYFDALLNPLPEAPENMELRRELEKLSGEELVQKIRQVDPERAQALDPRNRRRLIRALELIAAHGRVPLRTPSSAYEVEWVLLEPPKEELDAKIEARLAQALARGLIDEVKRVREAVGDPRLNELGLEYRIVGEYLRLPAGRQAANAKESLLPALSAKLKQYARRQRAWLRKLRDEFIAGAARPPGRS